MSRNLNHLSHGFLERLNGSLESAAAMGLDILVYCTYRDPITQARLYRQSRSRFEIEEKVHKLEALGFQEMANLLIEVGPQYGQLGKHVTFAGPGESWHNYGDAADAVVLVDGKPDWGVAFPAKWETWGEILSQAGLTWGGTWVRFRELLHIQFVSGSNPLRAYGPDKYMDHLDEAMRHALE